MQLLGVAIGFGILAVILSAYSSGAMKATDAPAPLWSTKPDVTAFEKIENDRLAAAQRSVDALVAVKGRRTIENTLVPVDEAIRQIRTVLSLKVNFCRSLPSRNTPTEPPLVNHNSPFASLATQALMPRGRPSGAAKTCGSTTCCRRPGRCARRRSWSW